MQNARLAHALSHPTKLFNKSEQKRLPRSAHLAAFTLIEVVFSLGLVSFTIVGMMGLMALGLTTMRQSMDFNTETAITQQLSGEAEVLNYSDITNSSSSYRSNFQNNRYFDEYGAEIANSPTPANFVYVATLSVDPCQMPGMSATSPVAQELIFKISTRRQPGSTNAYYLWAVDNGR